MPMSSELLRSPHDEETKKNLQSAKQKQAFYYNRTARKSEKSQLQEGQTVRVKLNDRDNWTKAEIERVLPYRSYIVKTKNDSRYRLTSRHVRFSQEPPPLFGESSVGNSEFTRDITTRVASSNPVSCENTQRTSGIEPKAPPVVPPITTRSGRLIVKPASYRD